MWEFPSIPLEPDRALGESRAALEAYTHNVPGLAFLASLPCCWSTGSAECQHLFSHISMTMTVQRLTYRVRLMMSPCWPCSQLVMCEMLGPQLMRW